MSYHYMSYSYSPRLLTALCNFEGFRAFAYQDSGGLWTIGYGQRCGKNDFPQGISTAAAEGFLRQRLDSICKQLEQVLPGLLQHQVDALCLFIYNIGFEAFTGSHTGKLLGAHDIAAFMAWEQWIHDASGKVAAGLVTRRKAEAKLFAFGVYP